MLNEIYQIYTHELRSFFRFAPSALILLLVTALAWGFVIAGKVATISDVDSWLWVIFFALVTSAGFSSTVFVRERLSSSLEVLVISGVERSSILWGKLIFTTLFTIISGMISFFVAWVCRTLILGKTFYLFPELLETFSLFLASSLLVNATSAFFSIALTNPRLVQFMNFMILLVMSTLFALASWYLDFSLYTFVGVELLFSILFAILAQFFFYRERIIQPLVY